MTLKETVQERTFWHILVMLTLSISFGYFMKVSYKSYGSVHFSDDKFLAMVGSTAFIAMMCAKISFGVI